MASASTDWLRDAAARALSANDPVRAWALQYVALVRDEDLTSSTLAARHDGGSNNGEFYDSDFGGPLYVDGDEGPSWIKTSIVRPGRKFKTCWATRAFYPARAAVRVQPDLRRCSRAKVQHGAALQCRSQSLVRCSRAAHPKFVSGPSALRLDSKPTQPGSWPIRHMTQSAGADGSRKSASRLAKPRAQLPLVSRRTKRSRPHLRSKDVNPSLVYRGTTRKSLSIRTFCSTRAKSSERL